MSDLEPALVERMVALVRSMVAEVDGDRHVAKHGYVGNYTEARAIAKLLPKPVDPDLAEAKAIHDKYWNESPAYEILVAIKRGRELQQEGK